ncbi:hypothetical protein PIB30_045293 [Stylosanthes scabra]|uniref:Uncharacterized protein n=1 Tax=Stylosanthes scabra TaxID=79078 RepID=A0ABU6UEU8_9FABA|nr:hypothetical protein [Stylosanthes scabra]
MAMKSFSVIRAQQIIMLLIIVGLVICFVTAESHEIASNKKIKKSKYPNFIPENDIKKVIVANGLRDFTKYCMEKNWHLRTIIKQPTLVEGAGEMMDCISLGFEEFKDIDRKDKEFHGLKGCVEDCIDKCWPQRYVDRSRRDMPPQKMTKCAHTCFKQFAWKTI